MDDMIPPFNPLTDKVEPTADMRTAAKSLREMYVAMMDEGFTENQTLKVLGAMLGTAGSNQ